jgi:hypothetical protein
VVGCPRRTVQDDLDVDRAARQVSEDDADQPERCGPRS